MRKILVVDDDPLVRQLVRDVLEIEGYSVDVVGDGAAALLHLTTERPDCMVLDVMMPGLDGHAVLARIRADEAQRSDGRPRLAVVMLTAAADDSQAWQAWSAGVDYFLAKPFDPSELLRYLDHLFDGAAA